MKKAIRGISKDKWNFPGGKIERGETKEKNILREMIEETGLKVSKLSYHGKLRFHPNGKVKDPWVVHIFSTKSFSGEPKSSEEGEVKWIKTEKIPFDLMWPDDKYWVKHALAGKIFEGEFYFDEENRKVIKYSISEFTS